MPSPDDPATPDPGTPDPRVDAVMRELDARAREVPDAVTGWYADPAGTVVVTVAGSPTPEVERFLRGVDPSVVQIVPWAQRPHR